MAQGKNEWVKGCLSDLIIYPSKRILLGMPLSLYFFRQVK